MKKKILSKVVSGPILMVMSVLRCAGKFAGYHQVTVSQLSKFGVLAVRVLKCAVAVEEFQETLVPIQRKLSA
jgi:hypothetical protein